MSDLKTEVPGARPPTYHWLNFSLVAITAIWLALAMGLHVWMGMAVRTLPLLAVTFGLIVFDAIRSFPGQGQPVRRRLPWLLTFTLPWIIAIVSGPFGGIVTANGDAAMLHWMTLLQNSMLAVSLILPFASLPFMRGACHFALTIGVLNFILTFIISSASLLIIAPGSSSHLAGQVERSTLNCQLLS